MKHIIDTESAAVVKFKVEAFSADENALEKHLQQGFDHAGIYFGNFSVMTEYIDFEKKVVGIEYDFGDSYSDAYKNAVWDCINLQLDSFRVTAVE
jgi:hypothetical protein